MSVTNEVNVGHLHSYYDVARSVREDVSRHDVHIEDVSQYVVCTVEDEVSVVLH